MILKGRARRGANDLALHLSNAVDNETVRIAELRGMVADNLYDGFREWQLICDQSNAKEAFYSLSINPDPAQRDWQDKEWQRAVDHIEDRLGLSGQPRAIVFHEKQGEDGKIRKHCHVVWSRIKTDNGQLRAIHLGHDYFKLKTCARDLSKEFGLDLGYAQNGPRKNGPVFDHGLSHGKNRDQQTAQARKTLLTKLWQEAENPKGFCLAASHSGFIIAQGERRAFVVIDQDAQIHALARQLEGVTTKAVKARLGLPESYPTIEQAKDEQALRKQAGEKPPPKRSDLAYEQRQMQKLRRMAQRADRLYHMRRESIRAQSREMTTRHNHEWRALTMKQRQRTALFLRKRADKKPTGFIKVVCEAIGIGKITHWLDGAEDAKRERLHAAARAALKQAHSEEAARLARKTHQLAKQEQRESQGINRLAKKLAIQKSISELAKAHAPPVSAKATALRLA
ncbi:relaxase/mobilization nuclease domain-containing protein [Hyphococcus lacteus]|uniref:MobA/VirD2-like nuclease domain-containing protein n=1 Tax=Hyphococcus lacteus TaxID=3143536 RepID=A0ABV3Z5D8_9PROT